jgi:exoribonuclease-2
MFQILYVLDNNQISFLIQTEIKKLKILGLGENNNALSFLKTKKYGVIKESDSLNEAKKALKEIIIEFNEALTSINIKELYEVLKDSKDPLSYKEMASLVFINPLFSQELALLSVIFYDEIYFKNLEEYYFLPEKENIIKLKLEKKERISLKDKDKTQFYGEVAQILSLKREVFSFQEQKHYEVFLKELVDFVTFEIESCYQKEAQSLVHFLNEHKIELEVSGNLSFIIFHILNVVGVLSEDENLLIKKYKIEDLFSNQLNMRENLKIPKQKQRKDFKDLYTFTIDSLETFDYDDAFSYLKTEHGYEVYVHIADVAEFIEKDTLLDKMALERNKTLYLPNKAFTMFPYDITYDIFALREGEVKLALTYHFSFSHDFILKEYHVSESFIKVDKNFSYQEVDEIFENPNHENHNMFSEFYKLSLVLQKHRIEVCGGFEFLFPQVSAKVKEDEIQLKIYSSHNSASVFIVKEWMILTNSISALICHQEKYPILYLNQEKPDDTIEASNHYISEKKEFMDIVKQMKKSGFEIDNKGHYSLGLFCYTQATSPIRRYLDIVIQRQLKAFLNKEDSFYEREELLEIKEILDLKKKTLNLVEAETNKFFLLKFLLKYYMYKNIKGVVIKALSLKEYLVELEITKNVVKVTSLKPLDLYEMVEVSLHTVIPRLGIGLGKVVF